MLNALTVSQLMSTPAVTVVETDTALAALEVMHRYGARQLPMVSDSGELIGVVLRQDILAVFTSAPLLLVGELASVAAGTINPDASPREAVQRMREHETDTLIVIDFEGRVAGVLSIEDLVAVGSAIRGYAQHESRAAGFGLAA